MVGRVVHRADFERLLATAPVARSAHFALHHLPTRTTDATSSRAGPVGGKLSTGMEQDRIEAVDNDRAPHRFGLVVPKRHARRAVTRNLVRRLGRQAMVRHAAKLPSGLWLLRLRAGFALREFVSARSAALIEAVRSELEALFDSAQTRRAASPAARASTDGRFDTARRAARAS